MVPDMAPPDAIARERAHAVVEDLHEARALMSALLGRTS